MNESDHTCRTLLRLMAGVTGIGALSPAFLLADR